MKKAAIFYQALLGQPLLVLLLLVFAFEFWELGQHPANSFDEARFGANAFEMMQNGDYLNLHYQQAPDAWVARPPLKAWLIIAGYKVVGFNEWGLRLSSGIFILLFFVFAFKWFELYSNKTKALFASLVLLTVKGIIGFHVGRSADMDAELIAFLAGFLYFFSLYVHFAKPRAIIWACAFLALAFWLKTAAAFFYLPGIFLYLLFSKKLKQVLTDKYFWYGAGILLASILAWVVVVVFFGTRYQNTQYAGDNALETMLIYDVWMRFTASQFDGHPVVPSYDFFFTNLDARYNVWNYLFYAGIGIFVYAKTKMRLTEKEDQWLSLCAWIILPLFVLLTFGMHKLDWYSAPLFPLFTVFVLFFVETVRKKWDAFKWLVAATLCFTLVRHAFYVDEESELKSEVQVFEEHKGEYQKADTLWVVGDVPSSIYLHMLWTQKQVGIVPNLSAFSKMAGRVGFTAKLTEEEKKRVNMLFHYRDERINTEANGFKSY